MTCTCSYMTVWMQSKCIECELIRNAFISVDGPLHMSTKSCSRATHFCVCLPKYMYNCHIREPFGRFY